MPPKCTWIILYLPEYNKQIFLNSLSGEWDGHLVKKHRIKNIFYNLRFEVFTVALLEIEVFCHVSLCFLAST
jgi:hypothetical protein